MVSGKVHTKRYFRLSAAQPMVDWGQMSRLCETLVRRSQSVAMPPTLPHPEALDHTRFPSTVSGVAHPLSPPPTVWHTPRDRLAEYASRKLARGLLGHIADGPSCRLP